MKSSSFDKPARRHLGWGLRLLAAMGSLSGSVSAMAAGGESFGTLTYGPLAGGAGAAAPTSIPTMGGIGLVLLSVFLLLVFWRLHRSGAIQGGGRFMVLALISGALASALGGVKLVSDAVAAIQISPIFLDMTEEAGGSLVLFESNHSACVRNNTSVRQKILSMEYVYPQGVDVTSSPEETCLLDDGASPAYPGCQVGQELQTGEVCGITADANLPL